MEPYVSDIDFVLYRGDARKVLPLLEQDTVDCVITSPPYFRLRDYGVAGQIGLEETIQDYLNELSVVFRSVWGKLKQTGSLWVNIDDSYAGGGNYRGVKSEETLSDKQRSNGGARGVSQALGGIKELPAKSLCFIPHRLALNLFYMGWLPRQEIIWAKPNAMVESARDRCTRAHEYVFHMTKQGRYYWDWDAAQEPAQWERWGEQTNVKGYWAGATEPTGHRNMRNIWTIPTANNPDAHFATFPDELVQRIIACSCPEGGTVLDPFMGSGTVARVARNMGRKVIGVELSPEYCAMIEHNTGQQSLLASG